MAPKHRDGDVLVSVNGKWVSYAHTAVAYTAFLGALIVGMLLHYKKIVQNEHYGFPQEWFPSVSATIGDRYPERSVFQLFIAVTAGPRFMLVGLWYLLTTRPNSKLPRYVAYVGLFRTVTCGGWTYVTSTDDHDWHDIFMISYLLATIPWTAGCLALSPANAEAVRYRKIFGGSFFAMIVPLVYFFIQHKVHRVAGAYTIYAFFEWSLVLLDVAFDACTLFDFEHLELQVKDVTGISRGGSNSRTTIADSIARSEKDKPLGAALSRPFSWSDFLDAAADVYNGFVFWSMLTSLGVVVWYFPLWYMGISGFEAFVLVTISPLLLAVGPSRSLLASNVRIIHLLSLSGILSFLVVNPAMRLSLIGFGVACSCLAWSATWHADRYNNERFENRVVAWTIGLVASSVAKFAFYSNNPIWPIMHAENGGWNYMGALVGALAILRSTRRVKGESAGYLPTDNYKGSGLLAAWGVAGLTFGYHFLLSDSSTMAMWVWDGHPVRGPIASTAVLTIFAMGAGIVQATLYPEKVSINARITLVAVGAFVLTAFHHWFGYLGGLSFASATTSLAPAILSGAVKHNPAFTFGYGFFLYNLLVLASVWTVAYAFVPGGPLLRERTDLIMTATVFCIALGAYNSQSGSSEKTRARRSTSRATHPYYMYVLGALQILALANSYLRFPTNDYKPYHAEEKSITAGIWTIHFALDNDMWSSERRMRDLIKEMELDVVGLLESDNQRIIMGNRDATQYLAEDLGMYVDFGPGPNKHTWGCALLSKFPILNSTHHLLPSPVGELAPAIHATVDAYGTLVDVFVFHSGQEEDPEDRRLQSLYLADLMGSTSRPSILLSYLVTKPLEGNYNTYVSQTSGMKDIDPSDWDRWCEYILYKGMKRSGYARVSRSTITDTELQVGKFVVGQPENGVERIDESQVPTGLKFPAMFRGTGVRGHAYHVFDEPRYFA